MLEPYSSSAIKIYHSTCATLLEGTIINFIEFSGKPIIFSVLTGKSLSVYMINPISEVDSFLFDLYSVSSEFQSPLFLFKYDKEVLKKYDNTFKTTFMDYFANYTIKNIENDRYLSLEDFYSYAVPEYYYSFFTNKTYKEFGKTGEITEIINFVRSIMFSKQVLLIDKLSTYKISTTIPNNILLAIQGTSIIKLPENSCLLDIQTTGLGEESDVICFSIYKNNSFVTYYCNDYSEEGQKEFREFVEYKLAPYAIIYVFSPSFITTFFPHIRNLVDIKFNKYKYFVTSRKLVHLPYHHLEYDPGSGKNVPIWFALTKTEPDKKWFQLILQRTVVNIVTKIAILSSNELSIPFNDNTVADIRRLRPTAEFLNQFDLKMKNLITKKICYYPTELFESYNFADGEFAEMYNDERLVNEKENGENE